MLSPYERRVLLKIERGLYISDPELAQELQTFALARRRPTEWLIHLRPRVARLGGRRLLLLAAVLSLLVAVVGVFLSHLVVGLVGITMCSVASCGYIVTVLGDFVRQLNSSP